MRRRYEQPIHNVLVVKSSAFVKDQQFFAEKVHQVCFEVTFVIELFLTQVIGERSKQVIVHRSQAWRVRWMRNGNSNNFSRVDFATCGLGLSCKK